MKNQKGFTLVELLAVIVILAVVILIAVTAVIPYFESQMDGGAGTTCFTVAWLNANKIDKKATDYSGYVSLDSNGTGTAYIKNSKFMINGGTGSLSKSNVVAAGTLTATPSGCQDAS